MTAQQLDWMGLVSSMILAGSLLFLSLTFVLELVDFLSWRSVDSELALAAFLLAFFFDPDFVVVPTESVTRLSPSSNVEFLDNWLPGLVTHSIIFCHLFTIKDQCKKVSFFTIKVCVSYFQWCPGTSWVSTKHQMVNLYLRILCAYEARLRAIEKCCVTSRGP